MFFTIKNYTNIAIDIKKKNIKDIAFTKVRIYNMTPTVLQLNQYLQNKYNQDLKNICKVLIKDKLILKAGAEDNTIIVTFKDKESDTLASLITYGNDEIKGCSILRDAFNQKYY